MELKEFISSALGQIVEGLESASDSFTSRGGSINPVIGKYYGDAVTVQKSRTDSSGRVLFPVRFSVSVTESRSGDSSGSLRVVFGSIRGRLGGSTSRETRLEFEVPCLLPDFPAGKGRIGRGE